jgi:hypothetical protein
MPGGVSDYDETDAWVDLPSISFTGPAGSAAGSEIINLSVFAHRRLRLKVALSADTDIRGWSWGKE